jgi:hypothetical protein
MAKHHGMRFWDTKHEIHVLPMVDSERPSYRLIHRDSLHFLLPQDGDRDADGYKFSVKTQAWWREDGWTHDGQQTLHAKEPHESRPAFRNGVAFMAPELEGRAP